MSADLKAELLALSVVFLLVLVIPAGIALGWLLVLLVALSAIRPKGS